MRAVVATVHDPFYPLRGRELEVVTRRRRIKHLAPATHLPVVCLVNGAPLLRAGWRYRVRDGDQVAFVTLPHGGGEGGSNVVAMVATLAIAVFAPYAGAWAAGKLGLTALAPAFAGATMVAGAALVSALIPPPKRPGSHQMQAPSPTYAIQAQGNIARLEQAIPVQYGRMMSYPDFAAQPYVEYAGNEQFLYQLFCIGQGEYEVEAVRIEDTAIASWPEVDVEVVGPGQALTLFPANVITSVEAAGQEMLTATYVGPFVANPAATQANTLGLDFVTPRGLYFANASGGLDAVSISFQVEARLIDDAGTAIGSWVVVGSETISAGTTTPQRISRRYNVAAGRYEVRVRRNDTKLTAATYGHEIAWAGLRAYLPEGRDFGNVTLLAMRIRATNNLSQQASRKVNVIATRKLRTWHPTLGWSSAAPSRSIAWALADACTNADYGARLPDSRVDLAALYALDAALAARGDTFDGRFDAAMSFWEVLGRIGQAGRTRPYYQGGIVRFARDAAASVPVALFSMRNIVRGSFSVDYLMPTEDTADAVEVSYFDSARWSSQRVMATLPGSTAARPARIDMTVGVTGREQAHREGLYQAACNRYRRRVIRLATEMEGFIPSFGDLIAVAHDLVQWGQSAEAVAWTAGTKTLVVSEPFTWGGSASYYVGLRKRDGSLEGPFTVTQGANASTLVLATSPSFTPYTGQAEERTHVVFGWGNTWRALARVVAVRPRGLTQVEILAVNENDNVHTADSGVTVPSASSSQLPTLYTAPQVAGLVARSMPAQPDKMLLSWQPAPGADYYLVEQSSDGQTWTRTGEPRTSNYTAIALYGAATLVRIAAVGLTRGPWVTIAYGGYADYMWSANDATLMWSPVGATAMWSY